MRERPGVLGAAQAAAGGRRLLILPDDTTVLVAPDASCEEVARRFGIDRVIAAPEVGPLAVGLCIDGPLGGDAFDYVPDRVGGLVEFAPSAHDRDPVFYEVVRSAQDGNPAELRFITEPASLVDVRPRTTVYRTSP